jgi:hypothetical protein
LTGLHTQLRSRESARAKSLRYLSEARVRIRFCDEEAGLVEADVRGNGRIYSTGRDERGWFCDCAARGPCAHVLALQNVVVLEPRESP